MSNNIKRVEKELERIASEVVEGKMWAPNLWSVEAQVLSAYMTFKIQEATFGKLSEQIALQGQSVSLQASTITELKQQGKWTKWLAIATTVLASATVFLTVFPYIKHQLGL